MTVCVPHELYRTPRLRQAARTLAASGESAVEISENEAKAETLTRKRSSKQFNHLIISNMNRFSKILVVFTSCYLCGTVGFAQTRSSLTNLDFELKRDSGLPAFF